MTGIHQLAAIMFSDIVGYTAMMEQDEETTLALIKKNREIHKRYLKLYNGKRLKEMGDGILTSFQSTSDAVFCAAAIMKEVDNVEGLNLKIGIHQGEIAVEGKEIYGDGVNVASRIEGLAQPNQILVSQTVYNNIKNKPGIEGKALGEHKLKNVESPVGIYSLKVSPMENATTPKRNFFSYKAVWLSIISVGIVILAFIISRDEKAKKTLTIPVEKSIAVLPFKDMSATQDQRYLCDGLQDAILNHLTRIQELRVISRTSTEKYRDSDATIPEISTDLGVSYVLEGGIQLSGDNLRITAQLIQGSTDEHIWSQSYDRTIDEIFNIQGELANQIANILSVRIDQQLLDNIELDKTYDTDAYLLYMKGADLTRQAYSRVSSDFFSLLDESEIILRQAIQVDPKMEPAYTSLAFNWLVRGNFIGNVEPDSVRKVVKPIIEKAISINPQSAIAHHTKSLYHLWYEWDFDQFETENKISIALNPKGLFSINSTADYYLSLGRYEEADLFLDYAYNIDPNLKETILTYKASNLFLSGKQEEALMFFDSVNYTGPLHLFEKARFYTYAGRYESAKTVSDQILSIVRFPRLICLSAMANHALGNLALSERQLEELIVTSNNSSIGSPAFYAAMMYSYLGDYEEAFTYLNKSFDNREMEMYWLRAEPPFKPLHQDPRFQELLNKVNFPE